MQSPSRRAFLTGRRTERSPWEAFLARLQRVAQGHVYDFSTPVNSARLVPQQMQDVYHARSLCLEYGIRLVLDGVPHAAKMEDHPVLWVEPGSGMERFERLGPDDPRWFVQPGCFIGELEQAGLRQFRDQPPHLTVAAWLADRCLCDWDRGDTAASGLMHALVLLADGTQANLGAFGVDNHKPLDNLRLQRMVPRLFELSEQAVQEAPSPEGRWNLRYRLDALKPADGRSINLAHLLLGHGGELGWIEWLVFDERAGRPADRDYPDRFGTRPDSIGQDMGTDSEVKALFDPEGLFPMQAQQF
ncbi:FAD-binding protein OS=Castellaniella defragrans OX=75697 GN=HNR28_000746 PE=4 SV=1 [Castellaniella defragrans]